jgi:predicted secreted acid phosphatase
LNLQWPVLITGRYMRIGCQRYTHEKWHAFTDARIEDMASGALAFWKKWKVPLLALCDANREAQVAFQQADLQQFGATNLPEIKPEQFAAVIAECEKAGA